MRLFIDSADPAEIKKSLEWGIVDGVTTNPSLAAKVSRPYKDIVREILELVSGPVSLEVIATTKDEMLEQAYRLHALGEQVVVKMPCTQDGIKATTQLAREGIHTNVTLVFSVAQALAAAKAGATYCSPFIGRLDDIAEHSGDQLIANMRKMYDHFNFPTQILAASIRDIDHVEQAARMGADAAPIPIKVLEQIISHPLTDKGLTKFIADWEQAGLELPA